MYFFEKILGSNYSSKPKILAYYLSEKNYLTLFQNSSSTPFKTDEIIV